MCNLKFIREKKYFSFSYSHERENFIWMLNSVSRYMRKHLPSPLQISHLTLISPALSFSVASLNFCLLFIQWVIVVAIDMACDKHVRRCMKQIKQIFCFFFLFNEIYQQLTSQKSSHEHIDFLFQISIPFSFSSKVL